MRFTTFLANCELIKNKLDTINKQVQLLYDKRVLNELDDLQINKLKLFSVSATQKNNEFEKQVNKMFSTHPSEGEIDVKKVSAFQESISELYIEILSKCNTMLPTANPSQLDESVAAQLPPATPAPVSQSVKLPPINIPTFSGNPEQWITFQNIFENAIHNSNSISNVEKFTYLLSSLTGEPLSLVKSLPINHANYAIAWQTLVTRYHNPRLLVTLHTNKILDLPSLHKSSTEQLRDFISSYNENYEALKSLGHDLATESLLLTSCILRKFDSSLRSAFEHKRADSKVVPAIDEVITFLENECSQREAASLGNLTSHSSNTFYAKAPNSNTYKNLTPQPKSNIGLGPSQKTRQVMFSASKPQLNCVYCNSSLHNIYRCNQFTSLSPLDRKSYIKSKELCQNCLGTHRLEACNSSCSCRVCNYKHHTLLHINRPDKPRQTTRVSRPINDNSQHRSQEMNPTPTTPPFTQKEQPTSALSCKVTLHQESTVLLATALVNLTSSHGHRIVARAVLDSASQATLISEHCANLLKLPRSFIGAPEITGISSTQVKPRGMVNLNISTLSGKVLAEFHPAIVLSTISSNLPRAQLSQEVKNRLKQYPLADPSFDTPGVIDLLLGADLFAQTLLGPSVDLGDNMPHTLSTIFGFVVLGNAPVAQLGQVPAISTFLSTSDLDLHATLQRFWSLEEPPHCSKLSPQNEECENHFLATHSRDSSGRYVCRLPFKNSPSLLGESSNIAKRTFLSLERKFQSQPEFKIKYAEFMDGYEASEHMQLCASLPSLEEPHCFLPHHGVFKDNKIRVVFNASAPTTSGYSINDLLSQGPKLHNDIVDIIFQFRQHKFVFLCDIKQMFRQILIHEEDQKFQLIYWRKDASLPLEVYQLKTVTFGFSSAPYLANRVIQQLISDEGENHPLAATALKHQIYVDDGVLGSATLEEGLALRQDVIDLLKKGKFELRKWSANHPKLLENLPHDYCDTPFLFQSTGQLCFNVLGLKWNAESDEFTYVTSKISENFTKRSVLSAMAQIYDPMGWLSPVVFYAKAFMQHLWTLGLNWDDPLPLDLSQKWLVFVRDLPNLEHITISRHLDISTATRIELHGFSDASETGFSSCTYLRVINSDNEVKVFLLIAKSRVAPLKRITLPRLELCGAHMLAGLLKFSSERLLKYLQLDSITAWCDSTIALSWIMTPPYRLKTYVSNRVAQIQELIPSCLWKHISTNDNPADPASRGTTASQLLINDLWFHGPKWLQSTVSDWTSTPFQVVSEELPELRDTTLHLITEVSQYESLDFLNKFSSWTTLLHVMCFVLRFISCLKNKTKFTLPFTQEELENSSLRICWLVQRVSFNKDIALIEKGKVCSNHLQRLSPFLDDSGIIRVGGRLRHSNLPFAIKHPILLPKNHHVVHLIIDHHHRSNLHVGAQHLQALLQQKYWILSARSVIRYRLFRCLRCYKTKPKPHTPLMGDLPQGRVTPTRPFNRTGVDYAGPFSIKIHLLRRVQPVKMYLCLFICFVTKAIHLEITTDLTSEAYTAALTRFISRRGLVRDLHSDCGSNFIGTASSLRRIFTELLDDPKLRRFAEENQINFHFLPPHAPHQGGLWERAIKSVKYHLHRVIGSQILTYEEFSTLCTRIEAILNSRPITPISADPHDLEVLTPGHFIAGGPLTSLIEHELADIPMKHLSRWQIVQSFSQQIWKRWQQEYLHLLQQRSKWSLPEESLKIGDLVIIHEDNSPPLSWKIGRISAVSPGKDGVVRVVQLRTATGTLSRPAVKVSRLPLD